MAFGVKYVPLSPVGYSPSPPRPQPVSPTLSPTSRTSLPESDHSNTFVVTPEMVENARKVLEQYVQVMEKTPEGREQLHRMMQMSPIEPSYDPFAAPVSPSVSQEELDERYQLFLDSCSDSTVEPDFFAMDNTSETSLDSFDFDMLDLPDLTHLTSSMEEPTVFQETPATGDCLDALDALIASPEIMDEAFIAKIQKDMDEFGLFNDTVGVSQSVSPVVEESPAMVDTDMESQPESSSPPLSSSTPTS
ncbi:hypothetical protein D9613_009299 [Agrocybe pediades]|uniref:Uncharacterized protein n=1 Tax=Agrocybe pediades TaxID=84607 RepID=A0A8H4R3C1_9AGAR|nr:hypothetical protein D9613_009299 [Agrocybe pediades]